jgi:hypothetical protein
MAKAVKDTVCVRSCGDLCLVDAEADRDESLYPCCEHAENADKEKWCLICKARLCMRQMAAAKKLSAHTTLQ